MFSVEEGKSLLARVEAIGRDRLPRTLAPCGVYYDCIPDSLEFLMDRLPKMAARLAEPPPAGDVPDGPVFTAEIRTYRFYRRYFPEWKEHYGELVRDLSACLKGLEAAHV